ncbi:spore coat protein [Clostridium novyi B str. ATCC 27606]|uniref:Spore coat protein n=1 Tax=Clostridium novyi B str. ATCC 27606 TaxID=1443123 RepID=A0AA40M3L3_CLONO|nr:MULTISPECIES: CotS family spore coat protein [Clostridium]KEI12922.1 spore coat protein [Clostridium novyi B str. NCTC 9691]KEI17663.1 spore coat protein [Clostridium novyi B str. ATCC 27606]OOB76588.1 spore coat protein [Clostridium haemolyticum]CAG7839252.1 Spore coat protein I [Clostridium haemolyticum]
MKIEELRNLLEIEYEIHITDIEQVKSIYKIISNNKEFCLKVIEYEFGHFFFILNAIKYLQNKGFSKIPEIIKTKEGRDYIKVEDKYAYFTPWINARLSNYDNPIDLKMATLKLAELHLKSKGFNVTKDMNPRVGWLKWIETYTTRKNEILDFKNRINKKIKRSKFDEMYLRIMNEELKRADSAIENLKKSNYIKKMKEEIVQNGFCHHDYAYHNVLIDNKNCVNIIDFDYCMLDTHLHDLSSILIRRMKYGKWDIDNAKRILGTYNSINKVESDDVPIMAAFMEFPQDYWQRGIQYYWEKKSWGEEFFIKKLERYIEDREEKQQFIEEFRITNLDNF